VKVNTTPSTAVYISLSSQALLLHCYAYARTRCLACGSVELRKFNPLIGFATGPGRRTSRQSKRGGVYPCCEVFQRRTEDEGGTQRERDEDRENARTRQETRGENKKSARATRWKTRGDLLLRLGVARVHLIYQTLRNAEGTTPKLNHYPSEAPALRRALRPCVASCDAPAL